MAIEAGFHSVHAFPMRLREQAIGALNLFCVAETAVRARRRARRPVPGRRGDHRHPAGAEHLPRAEVLTEQLQGALNSRILIEQAKGALSRIENVSVDEAFVLLLAAGPGLQRQRLVDVAEAVLHQE